jgi:hypothetical protein
MTQVAETGVETSRDIHIASPFTLEDHVAELDSRPSRRLVVAEPLPAQLIDTLSDMERELAVDVALNPRREQRVQRASKPRHVFIPRAGRASVARTSRARPE